VHFAAGIEAQQTGICVNVAKLRCLFDVKQAIGRYFSDMKKITLPDLPVDIECDPVALADFLLLKEEEECCDIDDFSPNLPSATLLQRSDAKATSTSPSAPVPKLAKQATSKISAERKQSALMEHERIRQALSDCGFLLEF